MIDAIVSGTTTGLRIGVTIAVVLLCVVLTSAVIELFNK